eukprot:TRINITY_DN9634_c0_g1_i1.p1 TRINITY_DN9634_c0_g1~~TRINITY_DN9634_c0_g1_i1.p1  ORF type:complete len:314 (+),score=55.95 TRINITY_DN9634_c0_g1_i1:153-1094(+)
MGGDVPDDTCGMKCARFGATAAAFTKKSIREYVLEFKSTDQAQTDERIRAAHQVCEFVNTHDVALFVLPAQVSLDCNVARDLLIAEPRLPEPAEMDVFDHEAFVLKTILGADFQPLPIVFVRGKCIGGLSQLREFLGNKSLVDTALGERVELAPIEEDALTVQREPLQLLHQAGGKPWYCFHLYTYGNVIRMISLFQVILTVICCILISQNKYTAAQGIATFIFFDCLLLTLGGPSPWSPTGALSTMLVWPRRGPVVTVLPYKVIFLFYAILLGKLVLKTEPFGSDSSSQQFDGQSEFITIAINSTLLAVLRF